MSWLDFSNNSNKIKQTYVNGFLDISGGNVLLRNGDLSLLYGNLILSSNSRINGNAIFNGNTTMNGNTTINGNVFINKKLYSHDISANGNIYCNTIYGDVDLTNIVGETLTVHQKSWLNGNVIIGTDVSTNVPHYALDMTIHKYVFPRYGNTWQDTRTSTMYSKQTIYSGSILPEVGLNFTGSGTHYSATDTTSSGISLFKRGTYDVSGSSNASNQDVKFAFDNNQATYWRSGSNHYNSDGSYKSNESIVFVTANPTTGGDSNIIPPPNDPCACGIPYSGSGGAVGITQISAPTIPPSVDNAGQPPSPENLYTFSVSGDWIQIMFPYKSIITKFWLVGNVPSTTNATYVLLGCNDDTSWNPIYTTPNNIQIQLKQENKLIPVQSEPYKNYKIVFTQFSGGSAGSANLSEWYMDASVNIPDGALVSYSGLAMSSTGQYQSISVANGNIYTSNNYGNNWTDISMVQTQRWSDVAISSTGQYQASVSKGYYGSNVSGNIHISSDYGQTWLDISGSPVNGKSWNGIAISGTGQYVTAIPLNEHNICISSDYGITWQSISLYSQTYFFEVNWTDIAMSENGQIQAVASEDNNGGYGAFIYVSTDAGYNWKKKPVYTFSITQPKKWSSIAMSSNGKYIAADVSGGNIYISNDTGENWFNATGGTFINNQSWSGLAMSSNGQYITAQTVHGNIYVSENYGNVYSWQNQTGNSVSSSWYDLTSGNATAQGNTLVGGPIAISATGHYQTTVTSIGNIYVASKSSTYPNSYNMVVKGLSNGGGGITQTFDKVAGDSQSYINIVTTDVSYGGGAVGGGVDINGRPYLSLSTNRVGTYNESVRIHDSDMTTSGPICLPDQSVIMTNTPALDFSNFCKNWTKSSAPSLPWNSICMSANGQYLSACENDGIIYLSSNYGQTWTQSINLLVSYRSICMSANGQYQSACTINNGIYFSSDYGQTWTLSNAPLNNWTSICMSANGQYQSAGMYDNIGGGVYLSSNYGQIWILSSAPLNNWYSICMSANGQYQVACPYTGIYLSSDYGQTWSQCIALIALQLLSFTSICISANGQYLSACVRSGAIYTSSNYGNTWKLSSAPSANWNSICISANGQYLLACVLGVGIYISSNYGNTWTLLSAPSANWNSICISANGQYLSACVYNVGIYTSVTPYPNIISSGIVTSSSMAINKQITDIITGYELDVSGDVHINGNFDVSNNMYAKTIAVNKPWTGNYTLDVSGSISANGLTIYNNGSTNTYASGGEISGGIDVSGRQYLALDVTNNPTVSNNNSMVIHDSDVKVNSVICLPDNSVMLTNTPALDFSNFGKTWTLNTSAPPTSWYSICMSANGQYQSACISGAADSFYIYISNNYGQTWRAPSSGGPRRWQSICMSANGQYQSACVGHFKDNLNNTSGYIYRSSNYGQTWTQSSSISTYWTSICMSANGQYQSACASTGIDSVINYLFTSNDYGQTWTQNVTVDVLLKWTTICMSANGQYQSAGTLTSGGRPIDGLIFISNDYGKTWGSNGGYNGGNWAAIRMSANGQYQSACQSYSTGAGYIYVSNNYGVGWTKIDTFDSVTVGGGDWWAGICISSNGQYQSACQLYGSLGAAGRICTSTDYGQTWTKNTNAPSMSWTSICMSSNGQYLSACVNATNAGQIYTSITPYPNLTVYNSMVIRDSDVKINSVLSLPDNSVMLTNSPALDFSKFGLTWTLNTSAPSTNWRSICMSANGQYQSACSYTGARIYTSSNYGQTWTLNTSAPSVNWQSICMSANGQYQSAFSYTGSSILYTSSNYGQTWTQSTSTPSTNLFSICMSANGQYQSACSYTGGYIYTSSNYGQTWTQSSAPSANWQSICMSANGQYQSACNYDDSIYTSSNYGQTWSRSIATLSNCYSICMSANGQYQSACVNTGGIYTSSNYGQTWTLNTNAPSPKVWHSICMSANGQYQSACVTNYDIYTSINYGQTWTPLNSSSSLNDWQTICMSANGQYLSACVNAGGIYTSITPYPDIYCGTVYGTVSGTISTTNITVPGYITAGTVNPGVAGTITAAGQITGFSFNASSDYRIKENVQNLDETFTIDNLRPVHYDTISNKHHAIGFIAHEIQEHYPYLVDGEKDSPNKTQSMNYNGLIGILVHEIQQLKQTIGEQKSQIADILGQISDIKK